ncbi:Acetate kinase [hydrothermal vent metagenome]|uniref:Acetate kinase n=1 Tax=hydrothermal vent metagenome TaxID=652676 RepID=A0A3B0WVX0_9ZZZZ
MAKKTMKILVLNSGSSSLKFQLFSASDINADLHTLAFGLIEQIGTSQSTSQLTFINTPGAEKKLRQPLPIIDHRDAIMQMTELLGKSGTLVNNNELTGIGHRVVHGGEAFKQPVIIDDNVIAGIEALIPLAPLHNPASLMGIRMSMEHARQIPQVAVFDTAFHQSIPEHAYLYALPYVLYEQKKIRRYGFHGTSHSYVTQQAARHLNRPIEGLKIISLHLGNGASAAAIRDGKCIDTSMGMTPLEGLIMGTRSGDLDPAILFYLNREAGMNIDDLDSLLNKKSGLKGLCGESDMRAISQAASQGDTRARLALRLFCYRLKKYIGAYIAALGGVDCIIFTGGIGENSAIVRQMCCEDMQWAGLEINTQQNSKQQQDILEIQTNNSQIKVIVIPTNEEYEIARQTLQLIHQAKSADYRKDI